MTATQLLDMLAANLQLGTDGSRGTVQADRNGVDLIAVFALKHCGGTADRPAAVDVIWLCHTPVLQTAMFWDCRSNARRCMPGQK